MSDNMMIGRLFPQRIPPGAPQTQRPNTGTAKPADAPFQELLDRQLLKFSQHAKERLSRRGIELDANDLGKLEKAVDKAAAKGARESLIMFRNTAFIVSVENKTVVTAIDDASMKDQVITQIDSAVIVS